MSAKSIGPRPSVNGLRTLELGSALLWLREQLQQQLGSGVYSISLSGTRTSWEQRVLGLSQILVVMFPFAIELALKSLWDCFHEHGTYERRHDLDILFLSLDQGAKDSEDAKLAQQQARELWSEFKAERKIHFSGSLDEFLATHARDFVDVRYHTQRSAEYVQLEDLVICFYCIVYPLAARDPSTFSNLLNLTVANRQTGST